MRIGWFTPLSKRTGISKYSLSAASALAAHADVDVWTTHRDDDYAIDLPVRSIDELLGDMDVLDAYDLVIYNLGNNPDMHSDIFDVYERYPGVVIQHDKSMAHFMRVAMSNSADTSRYSDLLHHYYGPKAAGQASRHALGLAGPGEDIAFLEPCLFNALAVVVHSEESVALVDRYPGVMPVVNIDLPYFINGERDDLKGRLELGLEADAVVAVTHGHVGESKRIEYLLRAVAVLGEQTRERLHLVVAGGAHPGYMTSLAKEAKRLGVAESVTFTGWLDDRDMYSYLAAADVFVNLRYPSTESASGSLVEQLYVGKPVIVSDVGLYSSLPDDVVIKTPAQDDGTRIAEQLELLVGDQELRESYAERVRDYADRRFSRQLYGERLYEFLSEVHRVQGRIAALDELGDEIVGLVAPDAVKAAIERAAAQWTEGT
jgi:glycosyltransferase involved in cell wall biosynthesis